MCTADDAMAPSGAAVIELLEGERHGLAAVLGGDDATDPASKRPPAPTQHGSMHGRWANTCSATL